MSRLSTKPIGKFIEERTERLGKNSATIYSVTNDKGFVRSLNLFDKQVFSADTGNYKRVEFHDLAYNPSRINVGSVAMCEDENGGAVSPMYCIVRCKSGLLPKYLLRFLKSDIGFNQIRHRCEGAVRFQLKFRDLSLIPIYLPPLAEQERIVKLLDEADELRKLRAQADRRAAALIPALFHEMFGPAQQSKAGWGFKPLGELTTRVTKGESPGWQGFEYTDKGPLFVTSENVLWGELDLLKPKHIPMDFHKKLSRCVIQSNDVLLNLVGASIGRACIFPSDQGAANVNQAVAVISCGEQIIPEFLLHLLLSADSQIIFHGGKVEAARANISLGDIRKFKAILPPLALQKEFAARVSEIRGIESAQSASRKRLDDLFQSMLHRAFEGEL